MKPLFSTLSTLPPLVEGFVRSVIKCAGDNFARDGQLEPAVFARKPGEDQIQVIPVPSIEPENKHKIWDGIRLLRAHCPLVAFINEVWMVRGDKDHPVDMTVPPSESPDRVEKAMFTLWLGRRSINLLAEIKRHPNALGEWEVMFDSARQEPDGPDHVEGAMVDGVPYTQEEN